jgi:hypothetical protein
MFGQSFSSSLFHFSSFSLSSTGTGLDRIVEEKKEKRAKRSTFDSASSPNRNNNNGNPCDDSLLCLTSASQPLIHHPSTFFYLSVYYQTPRQHPDYSRCCRIALPEQGQGQRQW